MRAGLLTCDPPDATCYRFDHEVVREVLRSALPAGTRASMRRRLAQRAPGASSPVLAAAPAS
jgi:hypothetical protein